MKARVRIVIEAECELQDETLKFDLLKAAKRDLLEMLTIGELAYTEKAVEVEIVKEALNG